MTADMKHIQDMKYCCYVCIATVKGTVMTPVHLQGLEYVTACGQNKQGKWRDQGLHDMPAVRYEQIVF